jgi:hypothetical protein
LPARVAKEIAPRDAVQRAQEFALMAELDGQLGVM